MTAAAKPNHRLWLAAIAAAALAILAVRALSPERVPEATVESDGQPLGRDDALPRQTVRILVVTEDGAPATPLLRKEGLLRERPDLAAVATREQPGAMIGVAGEDLWAPFGVGAPSKQQAPKEARDGAELVTLSISARDRPWVSLVSNSCVFESRQIDEDTEAVRFSLDPEALLALRANVRATVVDADSGAPVAASVTVGKLSWFKNADAAATDPETGGIVFEDLAPGHSWWIAHAEGYAENKRELVIPGGATLDLGTVRLQRPVSLSGSVFDAKGRDLEAILRLGMIDPSTGAMAPGEGHRYETDANGKFLIQGLAPARYVLHVRGTPAGPPLPYDPHLRSLPKVLDTRGGSMNELRLTALPTSRVSFPTGKLEEPWPYLEVLSEDGLIADTSWLGRWFDESAINVLPGDYTLRVRRRDGSSFERPLNVGSRTMQLEFPEGLGSAAQLATDTLPR